MRIVLEEILIGTDLHQAEISECLVEIRNAIRRVVWPLRSRSFTINPTRDGNGVVPIKAAFLRTLRGHGWDLEQRMSLVEGLGPGNIDGVKRLHDGLRFAVEWETGNISSSHRALNKMCVGMLQRQLAGGVLVLPDRSLYDFLTQRVGNYQELEPYFPVYRNLRFENRFLAVISVAHDAVSRSVVRIPKGSDGNAVKRRLLGA